LCLCLSLSLSLILMSMDSAVSEHWWRPIKHEQIRMTRNLTRPTCFKTYNTHRQSSYNLSSFTSSSFSNPYQASLTSTQSITTLNNSTNTKHLPTTHITMSSTTKPSTCCGRSGEGCVCAAEAKCSCGQKSAGQCNCEKASTENAAITGAKCSCGELLTFLFQSLDDPSLDSVFYRRRCEDSIEC